MERNAAEKETKQAFKALHDMKLQLDESLRNLIDVNNSRQKLLDDKNHLAILFDEKELLASQLHQIQGSLKSQLDSANKLADDEAKVN